jgi:hypothetical protein
MSGQTRIRRNYLENVPTEIRDGAEATLCGAINERNRSNKKVKFGFSTSEDALTWTVFKYLQSSSQLGSTLRSLGVSAHGLHEPELLLWGVPQPQDCIDGQTLREQIVTICDRLGEAPKSRTEPDVITRFGASGMAFIEVKYRSGNDLQTFGAKHEKYLERTDAFADAGLIRESNLYELARNWRIGVELAKGLPFTLLNLVTRNQEPDRTAKFHSGLNHRKGNFRVVTWKDLLGKVACPAWLQQYLDGMF